MNNEDRYDHRRYIKNKKSRTSRKESDVPATIPKLLAGSCSGNLTVLDVLENSDRPATILKPLNDSGSGSYIVVEVLVDTTSRGENANNGSFVSEKPICLASG